MLPVFLIGLIGKKFNFVLRLLSPILSVLMPLAGAIYGTLIFSLIYFGYIDHTSQYPLLMVVLSLCTSPWSWLAQKEKAQEGYAFSHVCSLVSFVACFLMLFIQLELSTVFAILFTGLLLYPVLCLVENKEYRDNLLGEKQGDTLFTTKKIVFLAFTLGAFLLISSFITYYGIIILDK